MIAGYLTTKNGYWYGIVLVRDGAGKQKSKWISTHLKVPGNKRRAEELLMEARIKYTNLDEIQRRSRGVLFSEYMVQWVQTCQGQVSLPTYASYKNCVERRIAPYFAEKGIYLLDLKPSDLLDYYNTLYAKNLTGNSVLHYHVIIRKALQEAYLREIIPFNVADRIPRPKKEPAAANCYGVEECKKLLQAIEGDPLEMAIIFSVIFGLRRSETLGLRWGAINFTNKTVTICHTIVRTSLDGKGQILAQDKVKSQSSFRTLPLIPFVEDMLREKALSRYGEETPPSNDYICVDDQGKLFSPNYLSEHFQVLLAHHGLRKIRYHDLRHSCANLLISARVPLIEVQQWLGHSTMSTTADLYSHLEFAAKERSAETISKLLF